MIYFDILIKNGQSVRREMGTAKIRFLLTKSISQSFLNFLISNFHKMSYFMPYFDNLMKKIGVTCEKFVLSKLTKYQKFTVRSCYLHGSQRSTEHISVIFAVFCLKFPLNILFHDMF